MTVGGPGRGDIRWRLAAPTAVDAGDLAAAGLCAAERARWTAFRVPKRRDEWLAARVNAKALVLDLLAAHQEPALSPRDLFIDRRPSGAPIVRLAAESARSQGLPGAAPFPVVLSISHSRGHALAAAAWLGSPATRAREFGLGADLEYVEPRSDGFIDDFFTPPERAWCHEVDAACRAWRANLVWSAKEAVLKVIQRGLSVDAWWFTCLPSLGEAPSWIAPAGHDWHAFAVSTDRRLPRPALLFEGAWTLIEGFVLTIAVGRPETGPASLGASDREDRSWPT